MRSGKRKPMWFHFGLIFGLLLITGLNMKALADSSVLRVLSWPGYSDEDVVRDFERQSGHKVSVTYASSDDDLWNKISTNQGKDFDVFAVNTAELQRYMKIQAVGPLDMSLIPNTQKQLGRFKSLYAEESVLRKDGKVYAIPYTYSEMGLIYNKDKVTTPPNSIKALWDPQFRGKVLAFDTSNHNFTIAAQALGMADPFQLTREEMLQAAVKLVDLRRNIFTLYTSPEEALQLYKEGEVDLIYANFGTQQVNTMRGAGLNIGYVIPQEGAFAWLDCWVVTVGAKDKKAAHRWIDFELSARVGDLLTQRQGLANTLSPAQGQTENDKIIWLEELEDSEARANLWERIRAGETPEAFQ